MGIYDTDIRLLLVDVKPAMVFHRWFCYNDDSDTIRCLYGGTNYPLLMGEKFRLTVDQKQFKIEWNLRK